MQLVSVIISLSEFSILHVIYANTISVISSFVNFQRISGFSFFATNIACVAAVQVDLTVPPHQGRVGHNFGTVEAAPGGVDQSLHHGVQHLIQICIRFDVRRVSMIIRISG